MSMRRQTVIIINSQYVNSSIDDRASIEQVCPSIEQVCPLPIQGQAEAKEQNFGFFSSCSKTSGVAPLQLKWLPISVNPLTDQP